MPPFCKSARPSTLSAILTGLILSVAVGEGEAAPISSRITYSTSGGFAPQVSPGGNTVFEFKPVTDGVATLGSVVKLGSVLVHQQAEGRGKTFDNVLFRLAFQATKVGDVSVPADAAPTMIDGILSGTLYEDGKVYGGLHTFLYGHQIGPWTVAGAVLELKHVEVPPLWNIDPTTPVVAIDVYARLDGTTVPEPATWMVFASAAGFGLHRLERAKKLRKS